MQMNQGTKVLRLDCWQKDSVKLTARFLKHFLRKNLKKGIYEGCEGLEIIFVEIVFLKPNVFLHLLLLKQFFLASFQFWTTSRMFKSLMKILNSRFHHQKFFISCFLWHSLKWLKYFFSAISKQQIKFGKFFLLLSFYPLSSCQTFLSSHFRTNWLSWLGLGNQVGTTTDHL